MEHNPADDDEDVPLDPDAPTVFAGSVTPVAAQAAAPSPSVQSVRARPSPDSVELLQTATTEFITGVGLARTAAREANARAERAEARCVELETELARMRGSVEWATVRAEMAASGVAEQAREAAERECGDLLSTPSPGGECPAPLAHATDAVSRFIADALARATYAELCLERRRRAHQCELENLRAESEARIAELETRVMACRAEVADARAQLGTPAVAAALRAEVAALEARRAELAQVLGVLRGEVAAGVRLPVKSIIAEHDAAKIRTETRASVFAEAKAAALIEIRKRHREEIDKGNADADRLRRTIEDAKHRVVAYQEDAARVAIALEGAARHKIISDLAVYHKRLETLMGLRRATAAVTLLSPLHARRGVSGPGLGVRIPGSHSAPFLGSPPSLMSPPSSGHPPRAADGVAVDAETSTASGAKRVRVSPTQHTDPVAPTASIPPKPKADL